MALLLLMGLGVYAQSADLAVGKTRISVEIDPATFVFKGYGIHLRLQPKNSAHLLLGLGAYAMDFPAVLVNLNQENKDMGWNVRLNQGYGLFSAYHFSEVNRKWFVGGQLAWQEYKVQKENVAGEAKFSNMLLMGLGGYTFQPFDFGLYFKFWGGLGYTGKIGGDSFIGRDVYDISPILMFGALHIGFTFN